MGSRCACPERHQPDNPEGRRARQPHDLGVKTVSPLDAYTRACTRTPAGLQLRWNAGDQALREDAPDTHHVIAPVPASTAKGPGSSASRKRAADKAWAMTTTEPGAVRAAADATAPP